MNDEQTCRQAYDDFYHKIKAEVGYDHWCVVWRFISKRQARGEPVAYISGWHNGYLTIKMLDPSFLPHDNMALYAKPQPQHPPEGYKLVPIEPTEEMIEAADRTFVKTGHVATGKYKAMLEAAPEPKGKP